MRRLAEHVGGLSLLDDSPALHHRDAVGDTPHGIEIVADEQHRGTLRGLPRDELEDAVSKLRVERRRGLVREENDRRGGDSRGDEGALAQTAAQLARSLRRTYSCVGDAGLAEQLEHSRTTLHHREARVQAEGIIDFPPDEPERVERDEGVLADGTDRSAAELFELTTTKFQHLSPGDLEPICGDARTRARKADERPGRHALSRSGLPDEREAFARGDRQGDSVDRGRGIRPSEPHRQIVDSNDRHSAHESLDRFRRLRPRSVVLAAARTIASPGKNVIHQNEAM